MTDEPRDGVTPGAGDASTPVDPRAVRVGLAAGSARPGDLPVVVGPALQGDPDGTVRLDGRLVRAALVRHDDIHVRLIEVTSEDSGGPAGTTDPNALILPAKGAGTRTAGSTGLASVRREVVVDGWRIEVDVESERRAALRERARRGGTEATRDGPTEVRAIIPGVVVAVMVATGDTVTTGQQLLVVEAMKMQNELRSPRDGIVGRVTVGPGQTIEVGDMLLVLE